MNAPACSATGKRRFISEDVRCAALEQGVPGSRGLGHISLGIRPRGQPLNISIDADGLGPRFRPGDVNPRNVTEAERIEGRGEADAA